MNISLDLNAIRPKKARLEKKIGHLGYKLICTLGIILALACIGLFIFSNHRLSYITGSLALFCYMLAVWYKRDLSVLPVEGNLLDGVLSGEVLRLLKPGMEINPRSLWLAISGNWQSLFITNRLLLARKSIDPTIGSNESDMESVWRIATKLALDNNLTAIEPGFIAAGILLSSKEFGRLLLNIKSNTKDVEGLANWLGRELSIMRKGKQYFGGIGRDWSFGFTPILDRFGENISISIEKYGSHFGWLANSDGVQAIENVITQQTGAVALIGPPGIGKTSIVYALAQKLIEGKTNKKIAYHQVIGLHSGMIISSASQPGQLESILMRMSSEAIHATNIILFLDDAQLFFGKGTGSFDATQILLPILQARRLPIILAMTPKDYQNLKITNSAFASLLTPVLLQEPPEDNVMKVLEDSSVGLEGKNRVLISYEALHEAYKLSGRYEQEIAYPGKAIQLLEQAISYSVNGAVTADSVQQAIEKTRGVKVGIAEPVEADKLLHLEDLIHQRMINQTRAVSVVANALRRSRAGVSNQKRPIGSFLFLGPTGVGKTELAKAIAASYFGSETNMIRIDMSEFQQENDVHRLLASGNEESSSLIMSVRQQPFRVVLLDEIEKAHPNVLNLLLQLLDEGQLTDVSGRAASFKDTIIITTSNAGAQSIREHIEKGEKLESFEDSFIDELINSGQFKPELLNRFDEIVLFRPLNQSELSQVVGLMIDEINKTLASQNVSVNLTKEAINKVVDSGYDPRLGARPMRRVLQRAVEDSVAARILSGNINPGDHVTLDVGDLSL